MQSHSVRLTLTFGQVRRTMEPTPATCIPPMASCACTTELKTSASLMCGASLLSDPFIYYSVAILYLFKTTK